MYYTGVNNIEILVVDVAIVVAFEVAKAMLTIARKHPMQDVQVQMEINSKIAYLVYYFMDSCVPSFIQRDAYPVSIETFDPDSYREADFSQKDEEVVIDLIGEIIVHADYLYHS